MFHIGNLISILLIVVLKRMASVARQPVSRFNFAAMGAQTNVSLGTDYGSHIPPKAKPLAPVSPVSRFSSGRNVTSGSISLGSDPSEFTTANKQPAFSPSPVSRYNFNAKGAGDAVAGLFTEPTTYITVNRQPAFSPKPVSKFNFNALGAQDNVNLGETPTTYQNSSGAASESVARAQAAGLVPKQTRFNPAALAAQDNAGSVLYPPAEPEREFSYARNRAYGN